MWPADAKQRFRRHLDRAVDTIVVQNRKPATKQLAGAALRRRDGWIARHASEAIVVWDGNDPAVGRTVRSLQEALGEDEVWIVTPPDRAGVPAG